tara:strand:- start:1223 stop:1432 length:210 start_codon:yes stop_codon:yes gene_type:complete
METTFRKMTGTAGDLQELLIGKNGRGQEASRLIPRTGYKWYRLWRQNAAKKKILRELTLLTGEQHIEKL